MSTEETKTTTASTADTTAKTEETPSLKRKVDLFVLLDLNNI